jgi:hypothetical protein
MKHVTQHAVLIQRAITYYVYQACRDLEFILILCGDKSIISEPQYNFHYVNIYMQIPGMPDLLCLILSLNSGRHAGLPNSRKSIPASLIIFILPLNHFPEYFSPLIKFTIELC